MKTHEKHILVVNQHGENRGDEAALRAMIEGLEKEYSGNLKFTIVVQFKDTNLTIPFEQDVTQLHMKMSATVYLGMLIYSLLAGIKIRLPVLLRGDAKKIIAAYQQCDVVVSAPGGPYFGDIYSKHEIIHWYYVWLALLFSKPLFLYAPSAGPFKNTFLNPVRKYFYPKFSRICLRETISKGYVEELIGLDKEITVTADSAIQQKVQPLLRREYFKENKEKAKKKLLVAVSAIEYKFPGEKDPNKKQALYKNALVNCLHYLTEIQNCHFLFMPQLYGKAHSDIEFLQTLVKTLPENCTSEIVDQSINSNGQRAIFGMCDICIASRYHPQIFAGTHGVPGICIYYEHKALGFMKSMGIEDFAFNIRDLDVETMKEKLYQAITNRDELSKTMLQNVIPIKQRSAQTTHLLVELLNRKSQ